MPANDRLRKHISAGEKRDSLTESVRGGRQTPFGDTEDRAEAAVCVDRPVEGLLDHRVHSAEHEQRRRKRHKGEERAEGPAADGGYTRSVPHLRGVCAAVAHRVALQFVRKGV